MQKTFPTVWISSIDHLNSFSLITQKNSWWKLILAINKVPKDFPQVKMGIRSLPIVFFSQGQLRIFERQIDFKTTISNLPDKRYSNLKNDFSFEIEYSSIKVERYLHPKPFMKAFNIQWIKLSILNNISFDHILLSFGDEGIRMKQIEEINQQIFEAVKIRTEPYSRNFL
jgi:hypothetical protein